MKTLLLVVAAAVVGATLLAAAAAATLPVWAASETNAADFYISPQGRDAWSGRLPAPNAAKTDGPFATLDAARAAVRKRVAAGLTKNVRVTVRGGTYYLPNGLSLGPEDGGTAKFSVTWTGYPGERARLMGGVPVTGWQPYKGSILRAPLPASAAGARQVFENGARRQLARTGAPGTYLRSAGPVKGHEQDMFYYNPSDFDPSDWDWVDGRVFIWPGSNWFSADKPLTGYGLIPEKLLTLGNRDGYPMKAGDRYFVYNVLALLDTPGEAVIQAYRKAVYLWPTQLPVEQQSIVLSTAPGLVTLTGRPGEPVRNVHFESLDLSISNGDVVKMTGAVGCSIRYCDISNGQDRGVNLDGYAQHVTVYGCHIHENGWHGVSLTGVPADKLDPKNPLAGDVNKFNVVENCHIHHCGRLVGHGYGVEISQSGHNRVVHNDIHHLPRYGTTIKGLRYQSLREALPGDVTWENHYDFLHGRNNLIAYNHIHHTNQDSQDTGAMESWGSGKGNVYDHNVVHDTGTGAFDLQSGFYLDDATDYFTLTNNVVYNVRGAGGDQPVFVKGIGNRIENNVLVVAPDNESAIRSLYMGGERTDDHSYLRNIVVFEPLPPGGLPKRSGWGPGLNNIHDPGKTFSWRVNIPADGTYLMYLRYAAANAFAMDDRTTLAVDGGAAPVPLVNLPPTGGWDTPAWSAGPSARLFLPKGSHTLTWTNQQGGGLNWDAFVLTDDPAWTPTITDATTTPAGKRLIVVQAESHLEPPGTTHLRFAYDFNNWSDERVRAADANVFFLPGAVAGEKLSVKGGPAASDWAKWRTLRGGKFDQKSIVADPLFVNAARRDYRLRPNSPALRLGIKSVDTRAAGLRADYPKRFAARPGD